MSLKLESSPHHYFLIRCIKKKFRFEKILNGLNGHRESLGFSPSIMPEMRGIRLRPKKKAEYVFAIPCGIERPSGTSIPRRDGYMVYKPFGVVWLRDSITKKRLL